MRTLLDMLNSMRRTRFGFTLGPWIALASLGCDRAPARAPADPPGPPRTVEEWPVEEPLPPWPDGIAQDEDGSVTAIAPTAIASPPSGSRPTQQVLRAAARDTEHDSDEPVAVRRYVYRLRLAVPAALGSNGGLETPGTELLIDASAARLRARFVGSGWPVDAGAEVRLRGDSPGAYVFDGAGGRPLLPGEMSEWFEGGPRRAGPPLVVRRDPAMPTGESGLLVCALLAEWSGEPREAVVRRCDGRAPLGFRIGLWRGERTADLAVQVPARSLRSDELEAPEVVGDVESRAFFDPASLSRIEPASARGEDPEPTDPLAPREGLLFVNESPTRVIVTVGGVPIGWVAPRASATFIGLRPGLARVGAMRPLGSIAMRPRLLSLPARTVLRAPRTPHSAPRIVRRRSGVR